MPMRVGLVCPYDLSKSGGVQDITRQLAVRLRQAGDEVVLVGPGEGEGDFVAVGDSVSLRANRSRVPLALDPRSFRSARRALSGVDVVNVHEPLIPVVGWTGIWREKPVVATFHADPSALIRRLYRLASAPLGVAFRAATLTAVSDVAASAIPRRWGPVEVIPNAIDVDSYDVAVTRHPKRVAFLGRDDARKGLDVLLAAWPQIKVSHPDAELVVMGAERPQAPPGVTYLGRLDEAAKRTALASSAVYVAPNLGGESFGLVVAEAMAAGCAVVASDIPAFRSVLGDDGRLFPVGDSAALAGAVGGLLDDRAAATALGDQARASVGRFDWANVTHLYRRAYESALARHRSSIGPS